MIDIPRRQIPPLAIAGFTAVVSGVAVFVNAYGVHAVRTASVYTTAKNLVAAVVLAAGAAIWASRRRRRGPASLPAPPVSPPAARLLGLVYVAVVGGGIAFVLFFDGLAATTATPAAFIKDSMVVWVAIMARPLLGERMTTWNVAAVTLLFAGQVTALGGTGHLALSAGTTAVAAATVLWALEVVVAKRLLVTVSPTTLAVVRMGGGSAVLVSYLAVTGQLGALAGLGAGQWAWAAGTGGLLSLYVASWFTALSRARAVDVTSVLVASALVTAACQAAAGSADVVTQTLGLTLVAAGTALVFAPRLHRAPA